MNKSGALRSSLFLLALAGGAPPSVAQSSSIAINVSDPRPLAQAALQLERLIGIAVNYEDPPYAYPGDMQDLGNTYMSPQQLAANPGAHHIWVPRGGQISVDLSQVSGLTQASAFATTTLAGGGPLVAALVAQNATNNLPGVFSYAVSNGAFYISPTEARNASGSLAVVARVLDTPVTLPYMERTAGATVEAILQQLTQASGVQVSLGTAPINLMLTANTSIGASNESARSILGRTFLSLASRELPDGSTAALLAYHLYYDPGLKYYGMNVHKVPNPQPVGSRVGAQQPVQPSSQSNPYSRKK